MEPLGKSAVETKLDAVARSRVAEPELERALADLRRLFGGAVTEASLRARAQALREAAATAERTARSAGVAEPVAQQIVLAVLETPVLAVGGGGASAPEAVVEVPVRNHRWVGEAPRDHGDPPRRCSACPLEEHLERGERQGRIRVYRVAGREVGRIPGGSVPGCPTQSAG